MNLQTSWSDQVEEELRQAEIARRDGNEGRARVCARRAAGIIVAEYLERINRPATGPSAYDRLRFFCSQEDLPSRARQVASHFLERVTTEWTLPIDADLLAEAWWLADELLNKG